MKKVILGVSLLWASAGFAERAVVEMKAKGTYALAQRSSALEVRSTSPAGYDLSRLRYCLCADGTNVVCQWRNKVGPVPARLTLNVSAGTYALRITDGTWYYGSVPVTVLPAENPFLREGEALAFRKPGLPPRRIGDFWRDMWAGRQRGVTKDMRETPRRVTCVMVDAPAGGGEIPLDRLDATVATLQRAGANELIFPVRPAFDEAWRVKLQDADIQFSTTSAETPIGGRLAGQLAEKDVLTVHTQLAPETAAARHGDRAFVVAYRALPGILFKEIGRRGGVRLRQADWGTRSWFYLVNVGGGPEKATLELPDETEDVVNETFLDGLFSSRTQTFTLAPGELRVFRALEGRPVMR